MQPVKCLVKHDPPNSYGDCVRACIASLLSLPPESVPHFYHDGCEGDEGMRRIRTFLQAAGYGAFFAQYSGDALLSDVLNIMNENCPVAHYLLFGADAGGDHVVVCQNDKVVHNPAWYATQMIGPLSSGHWAVMVLVKL